mmetsp:Transcript_3323/g.10968  ORF Transcript_3323/g.10968 Transcript_3323/m.10968 type:complete len:116 (+) Transcript_3323:247-594(+)
MACGCLLAATPPPDPSPQAACVVGLDAEWKPREGGGRKGKPPPAALLQVACRGQGKDVIFLLDILQQPRIFTSVIQGLLRNKDIVKVGFHVMSDLQVYKACPPHLGPAAAGPCGR